MSQKWSRFKHSAKRFFSNGGTLLFLYSGAAALAGGALVGLVGGGLAVAGLVTAGTALTACAVGAAVGGVGMTIFPQLLGNSKSLLTLRSAPGIVATALVSCGFLAGANMVEAKKDSITSVELTEKFKGACEGAALPSPGARKALPAGCSINVYKETIKP